MTHVTAVVLALVYFVLTLAISISSVWIFCDARIRRLGGSFKWAAYQCFCPWEGLPRYLKSRNSHLLARDKDWSSTSASENAIRQKVFTVVALSFILEFGGGLGGFGGIVALFVWAVSMTTSGQFLLVLLSLVLLCNLICFGCLVGVWATGVVDFFLVSPFQPKDAKIGEKDKPPEPCLEKQDSDGSD
jgi:hypothetical protein